MDTTIMIYDVDSEPLYEVPVTKDCVHEEELMKSDFVRLSWVDTERYELSAGCYIMPFEPSAGSLMRVQYALLSPYTPEKTANGYKYQPEFQHPKMVLGCTPYVFKTRDANNEEVVKTEWPYVGRLDSLLLDICSKFEFPNVVFTDTQEPNVADIDPEQTVTVNFNNMDLLSAISEVANVCGCEWHLDWNTKTLYFGFIKLGASEIELAIERNVGIPSVTSNSGRYYNSYLVYGSSRNNVKNGAHGYQQVDSPLTLDETEYPGSLIDNRPLVDGGDEKTGALLTKILKLDSIYPKVELYMYNLKQRYKYKRDSNGKLTGERWTVWYVKLADASGNEFKLFGVDSTLSIKHIVWRELEPVGEQQGDASLVINENIGSSDGIVIFDTPFRQEYFVNGDNKITLKINNQNIDCIATESGGNISVDLYDLPRGYTPHVNDEIEVVSGLDFSQIPGKSEQSLMVDGLVPTIAMQINNSNGAALSPLGTREFEVVYWPGAIKFNEEDDVEDPEATDIEDGEMVYNPRQGYKGSSIGIGIQGSGDEPGYYEIIHKEEGSDKFIVPTTEELGICPKTYTDSFDTRNNKCSIFNVAVGAIDAGARRRAQTELKEEALRQIAIEEQDTNNYTVKSNPVEFESNNPNLTIGCRVLFTSGELSLHTYLELHTRVTKLVTKLDFPFEQEITVGNKGIQGTISSLNEKIDSITRTATDISVTRPNSSPGGGSTPTGIYLSKIANDIAAGHITFQQGLQAALDATFGTYYRENPVEGSANDTGAAIKPDGTGDFINLIVRAMVRGDLTVEDLLTAANITFNDTLQTPGFMEAVGLVGRGLGAKVDVGGKATLQTDDLVVLGRMLVNTLEIREVSYIGGVYLLTPAGSRVAGVLPLYAPAGSEGDPRWWTLDAVGSVSGYRLFLLSDDGTTATMNYWRTGDQAYCRTFNIDSGVHHGVSNSAWWRLVTGTGSYSAESDILGDGKGYHYIDVSDTAVVTLWDGDVQLENLQGGYSFIGYEGAGIVNSNTVPKVDDRSVCLGSQVVSGRQGALQLSAEGSASVSIFDGICDYDLASHLLHHFSKDKVSLSSRRFEWSTASGASVPPTVFRGAWYDGAVSSWGDEWTYGDVRWTCILSSGTTTEAPGTTPANWQVVHGEKGDAGEPSLRVEIWGSDKIHNGEGSVTLTAHVIRGESDDITSTLRPAAFSWIRESLDSNSDSTWNALHYQYGSSVTVTKDDVLRHAVFACEVNLSLVNEE